MYFLDELKSKYRCDYICYGQVILEVKVVERLVKSHYAQLIHYLKATGLHRGLLINFGAEHLEVKRIVLNY
jgi:GxxExxY protein